MVSNDLTLGEVTCLYLTEIIKIKFMTVVKKVTRIEYAPAPIHTSSGQIMSEIITYFYENGKVDRETMEMYLSDSNTSCIIKHYDEHWNLEDETYYENGELIASASAYGLSVAQPSINKPSSFQVLPAPCDTIPMRPMFLFAIRGKMRINVEKDPSSNRMVKRAFSKVMDNMIYLREEFFEYY